MPLEVWKSGSEQAQSNLFARRWLSVNEAGTEEQYHQITGFK